MTVGELIDVLRTFDASRPVLYGFLERDAEEVTFYEVDDVRECRVARRESPGWSWHWEAAGKGDETAPLCVVL